MQSVNEIANLALARLGVSLTTIDILTENTQQAKVIRRQLQTTLDSMASKYEWNFLNRYQALTLHVEDPDPMHRFAYKFPSDCLVIREVAPKGYFTNVQLHDNQVLRFQEQYWSTLPVILTNVAEAHARYTSQCSTTQTFPNHFARAVSAQLAMDVGAQLITNNYPKLKQTLIETARADISEAIAEDLSRQPDKQRTISTFARARRGY